MLRGGVDHLSDVADRYPSTRISDLPSIYPALREEGITGLESGTDRVTFDPRDIRSYFSAAFDPDYTGPNILGLSEGSSGGPSLLVLVLKLRSALLTRRQTSKKADMRDSPTRWLTPSQTLWVAQKMPEM
jgi:hypothetical protein